MARPTSDKPIETPRRQRLAELAGAPLAIGVWAVAVLGVAWILTGRVAHIHYIGIAQATHYEISPVRTGKVDRVLVALYERVAAGQIVATLDASEVRARLQTAKAELARLDAELQAVAVGSSPDQLDQRDNLRRFHIDVENRRLEDLSLRVTIESDEVEAQLLALQLDRIRALHRDGVVSDEEFDDVHLRHREVVTTIDANRVLLAKVVDKHAAARSRLAQYERGLPFIADSHEALLPVRLAVEVQQRLIDEVEVMRQQLVLRAPVAGQASSVVGAAGQAVLAGEVLVTIAREFADEIVAYAPAEYGPFEPASSGVVLYRPSDPGTAVESVIVRVSPTIELLPERLWRIPGRGEYGRAFVVAAAGPLRLVPGEAVGVRVLARD